MKIPTAALVALFLGLVGTARAEGELVYPWDGSQPAPGSVVPCVPCVLSLPGLSVLRPDPAPSRAPGGADGEATVAVADRLVQEGE